MVFLYGVVLVSIKLSDEGSYEPVVRSCGHGPWYLVPSIWVALSGHVQGM